MPRLVEDAIDFIRDGFDPAQAAQALVGLYVEGDRSLIPLGERATTTFRAVTVRGVPPKGRRLMLRTKRKKPPWCPAKTWKAVQALYKKGEEDDAAFFAAEDLLKSTKKKLMGEGRATQFLGAVKAGKGPGTQIFRRERSFEQQREKVRAKHGKKGSPRARELASKKTSGFRRQRTTGKQGFVARMAAGRAAKK